MKLKYIFYVVECRLHRIPEREYIDWLACKLFYRNPKEI